MNKVLIHISLAVILVGGVITCFLGEKGHVRLDPGATVSQWVMNDGTVKELPVLMTLEKFQVERYPDSEMPSDYRSTITAGSGADTRSLEISMNRIARIDGYRFYQADYDGDSSILMVVHDPWGIGVTYAGYILLLLGMLGYFFKKDTEFRKAVARLPERGSGGWTPSPVLMFLLRALAAALLTFVSIQLWRTWLTSGHAPFVGGYAVMMVMAWLSALAMIVFGKRLPVLFLPGFLLAFFTILLAYRAGAGTSSAPLAPVLRSPLLSVHVLAMMMSYTLFGIVMVLGIIALVLWRKEAGGRLMGLSMTILYPAVFLITFGTVVGSVWANISWGSYWSWDPKETWALITLLVYAVPLHSSVLKLLKRPLVFHIYVIIAFLSVLITYFGVNLVLGGMHSYS